eukprot:PhM_4_TR15174/c1_g3_i1/m.67025
MSTPQQPPQRSVPSPTFIPLPTPSVMKEHLAVASWRDNSPPPTPPTGSQPPPSSPPVLPTTKQQQQVEMTPGGTTTTTTTTISSASKSRRRKKSKKGAKAGSSEPVGNSPGGAGGVTNSSMTSNPAGELSDPGLYGIRVATTDPDGMLKQVGAIADSAKIKLTEGIVLPASYALKIKRNEGTNGATECTPMKSPEHPPALENDSFDGMALLPPAVPTVEEETTQTVLACVATEQDAATLCEKVKAAMPTTSADVYTRCPDDTRSPTLVLKGIPFAVRSERMMEELCKYPWVPSYIRFHFSDRGMFKGIAYVKYKNRHDAERAKLVLERLRVGSKKLRVEYRKPSAVPLGPSATPTFGPAPTPSPSLGPRSKEDVSRDVCSQLELQLVQLLTSRDSAGLTYTRSALTREEQRFLKSACERLHLEVELTPDLVRVMRSQAQIQAMMPSPCLAPRTPPVTPSQAPKDGRPRSGTHPNQQQADDKDGSGLAFRGVAHWKAMRKAHAQLFLPQVLTRSPHDPGAAAWGAGRGKPVDCA